MPLSAQEQYLLELINRGRLDPAAEAARYGADLNAGLAANTISTAAKQALAPNALLELAAIRHSQWMLQTDTFSHTGQNGSTLGTRATAVGYQWNLVGENLAVLGTSGTLDLTAAIENHHRGLYLSAGHRTNLMNATLNEVGLAQETGRFAFRAGGPELNASMLTEHFGMQSGKKFLTGVVFQDSNNNSFYSVGEGRGATTFTVAGATATSETAGGYALGVVATGVTALSGRSGNVNFSLWADFSAGNVKLDVMNANTFNASASVWLSTGIHNVNQLGIANLTTAGNASNNTINGNNGNSAIHGLAGNDVLDGRGGNDVIYGGVGNDLILGGAGNDRMFGDGGADSLQGGIGADEFYFSNTHGADVIQDFTVAQGDYLVINDDLWTGTLSAAQVVAQFARVTTAGVVFDFGDGDSMTLSGVNSTAGLAAMIYLW